MTIPLLTLKPAFFSADDFAAHLSYSELTFAIESALSKEHLVPGRILEDMGRLWGVEGRLLLMLAGREGDYFGFKLVSYYPENWRQGLPSLAGIYVLFEGQSGRPLALFDGAELTAYRTAAASMLACRYLARSALQNVLVIGSGKLSRHFVEAYDEVFGPARITVWARDFDKASKVVNEARVATAMVRAARDLDAAVSEADVISTVTSASHPILRGVQCPSNVHIDLVGGFRPDMREADDDVLRRAVICVDTYQGALNEAGDLKVPLEQGVITRADVQCDLVELVAGKRPNPAPGKDLTVFKSVGAAFEDLAAAALLYERMGTDGWHGRA